MLKTIFLVLLLAHAYQAQQHYVPPMPLVEPLYPIGIRISIPDEPGIQLVAFHIKINDEMVGLEAGTIARDIPSAKRGRWTYHDKTTQLYNGDTIYYWIHVIYRGLGYNLIDQEHVVTDFYTYDGNKIPSIADKTTSTYNFTQKYKTEAYIFSATFIQPLSPAGIRISIPDEPGIRLVAFHVKINDEFVGLEAGTIARDIVETTNGYWMYNDKSTKLQKGDIIFYWIHVVYNDLGYDLIDQKYTVEDFYDYNGNKMCTENCSNIESNEIKNVTHGYHAQRFVPPAPLIEPLYPIGIRMSIPDEPGISLVAYHVKFNDEMVGLEAGTIARDIVKAKKDRWTYHDKTTQLYKGDVIYYWIHVVYRGLGYNLVDQEYVVSDFYDYNGNKVQSNDEGNDHSSSVNNGGSNNNNSGPNNNNNGIINNNDSWNQNNGSGSNNNDNSGNGNDDLNAGLGNTCKLSVTKQTDFYGRTWNPCAGQVLFYDNFQNWQTFQQKKWAYVEQFPNAPDYEFNVYRYSLANINVNNGLKITPKLLRDEYGERFIEDGELTLQQCTGKVGTTDCAKQAKGFNTLPPVTSSRVNTKNAINFEYGRVEIRAKLPRGDWLYPLLMLEPLRNDDQQLSSLRIRIGSANGNRELSTFDGRDISGKILWGGVTGLNWGGQIDIRDNGYITSMYNSKLWGDEYHNYEIVWTPGNIVLKVDGQSYYDKQVYLASNTPFYLTLGVAVGGLNEFPDWSISQGYPKPWRNVEAKALYNFFNSTNTWYNTWQAGATSLDVEYVRITAL